MVWRNLHLKSIEQKFKYQLYAYRDELRGAAVNGKIDPDFWLFKYFDETISKRIATSHHLTLFHVLALNYRYRGNKEVEEFTKKLDKAVKSNKFYANFQKEMNSATLMYIAEQHYITYKIFKPPVVFIFGAGSFLRNISGSIKKLWSLPGSSASEQYC
tara:strand:+ start:4360 stop:4833 length:474 start_codon:yes stop_codon:yes gene_type:complete